VPAIRLSRARIPAALLLASALVLGVPAGPAAADDKPLPTSSDPSAGSTAARAVMAAQAPLLAAADRITALAGRTGSGLGGIALRVDKRRLDVRWKGEPPATVAAEIGRLRRTGIGVDVAPSRYSQAELTAAARTVATDLAAYPGLRRIGPRTDGAGLEAVMAPNARAATRAFPLPTTVVAGAETHAAQRFDDTPPFWAGGVARPVGSSATCSTGFAVVRRFLFWEVLRGLLTAEHCSPGGNVGYTNGVGAFLGTAGPPGTAQSAPRSDSLVIASNAAAVMWDGPAGAGAFAKPVAGATGSFPGQFVCTSGASTGAHCNIRLTAINQLVVLQPSLTLAEGVALGTEISGGVAVGLGDSGGPVFTLAPDPAKVMAAGMIVGGQGTVGCTIAGQTGCLNQVAYVDIAYVLTAQQVSLLTG
jgi:hypothetical protein